MIFFKKMCIIDYKLITGDYILYLHYTLYYKGYGITTTITTTKVVVVQKKNVEKLIKKVIFRKLS